MRESVSAAEERRGVLTRRALLGAGTAALLGTLLPTADARGLAATTMREVAVPVSRLAIQTGDPLPSWNNGPRKQAILDFAAAATDQDTEDFVPIAERIATFNLDGTLWIEQPLYTRSTYTVERIRALAVDHPDWNTTSPFSAVLSGDGDAIVTFSNAEWLAAAKHPRFDQLYTDLVYQPMLEVMAYLRENDFRTYIVSGSGQEFIRSFADPVLGIPPEQVIGTTFVTTYEMGSDGVPVIRIDSAVLMDDNNAGKPQDIALIIGRRPAAAFGNSGGDQQMLEWTGAGSRATLMMLVHHDDAVREYAYGPAGGLPASHIGAFSEALMTEANERGWSVISMKNDWARIFPFTE